MKKIDNKIENSVDLGISVAATLWSLKTDSDGESTVVFKVPQDQLEKLMPLTMMTQKLLSLRIFEGE